MAPADIRLAGVGGIGLDFALLQLGLVEPRLQLLHRLGSVLVLAALVLAGDDDAGRQMGDADGAVGGVDVLAAGAAGAIGVDPQFGFVDVDGDVVVDLRIDPDTGEAGVTTGIAVVRADPDQPVDAAFGLQIAIGIVALNKDGRRLDPGLLAGVVVDQFDLHAVALGPAGVHPLQHAGPVLALGAAGAGIDLDIAVVGVGLAGQQCRHLVAVGAVGKLGQSGDAVVDQGGVAFRLGHGDQLDRVLQFAFDLAGGADRFFQALALAHDLLRRLGVIPQRRILDLGIELVEPLHRPVPVEESAQQGGGGIDPVDMGLRFGAHRLGLSLLGVCAR